MSRRRFVLGLSFAAAAFSGLPGRGAGQDEAVSFRGKIVLFGGQRPKDAGSGILAITPDGGTMETILEPTAGEWVVGGRVAPDGRWLAYSVKPTGKKQAEAWILGIDGGRRKVADDGMVVAWSPDGARLLCNRGEPGDMKSFFLDLGAGGEERLDLPAADYVEDLSPDGGLIAVVDANPGQIFKHPDATKGAYPLRTTYLYRWREQRTRRIMPGAMRDALEARFSPDGSMIAYNERRYHNRLPDTLEHSTMVMRLDGASSEEIIAYESLKREGNFDTFRFAASPCWSPEGDVVVTLADKSKSELTGGADMEQVYKWTFELLFGSPGKGLERRLDLEKKGLIFVHSIDWR